MKFFRTPLISAFSLGFLSISLVLEVSHAQPGDDAALSLDNPTVPMVPPFAITASCSANSKVSVNTGNVLIDAGAKIADTLLSDDELDRLLGDVESEGNKCELTGKIKISTKCSDLFPGGSGLKALPEDQDAACRLGEADASTGKWKFPEDLVKNNSDGLCLGACQERVVAAINAEKACLDQQEQQLREMLKSYSGQMDQFTQHVEKTLAEADGEFKEREELIREAQMLLGGDKESGKMGLIQAQSTLKQMAAALPSVAKNIKREAELLKTRQANFKTYQKQLAVKRAVSCFRSEPSRNSKMTCDGKAVPPYDYVRCQLNKAYMGRGKSKGNEKMLAEKKAQFDKIFTEIEGLAASSATPQGAQANGQPAAAAGSNRRIYDLAGLNDAYRGQLNALGKDVGFDVARLFSEQVSRCYQAKYAEVMSEVQKSDTELGMIAKDLSDAQANFSVGGGGSNGPQAVSSILTVEVDKYREALGAIGYNAPIDTQECLRGSPETQANCMQALANAVQSSLTGAVSDLGSGPLGSAAMRLTGGTVPRVQFDRAFMPGNPRYAYVGSQLKCLGINDCVTKLQKKIETDKKAYEGRVQEKKRLVNETNSTLLMQAKQLGNGFKAQSADMMKRIAQLRQAMKDNGFKVKAPDRDSEKRSAIKPKTRQNHNGQEESSLYSAADLEEEALHIAGAPGILKELDAVTDGMDKSERAEKIAEKMGIAKENLTRLASLESSCQRVAAKANREQTKDCMQMVVDGCKRNEQSSLKAVLDRDTIQKLNEKYPGVSPELIALINSGGQGESLGGIGQCSESERSQIFRTCMGESMGAEKDLGDGTGNSGRALTNSSKRTN